MISLETGAGDDEMIQYLWNLIDAAYIYIPSITG